VSRPAMHRAPAAESICLHRHGFDSPRGTTRPDWIIPLDGVFRVAA
jgi:hypothetical protein